MSTRSMIGKVKDDGSVVAVYCHSDGYPEWNGMMLAAAWSDPMKVDALLALGGLQSLCADLGRKHDVHDRTLSMTTAYHRDHGLDMDIQTFESAQEYLDFAPELSAEWVYLFDAGQWYYLPADGGVWRLCSEIVPRPEMAGIAKQVAQLATTADRRAAAGVAGGLRKLDAAAAAANEL